MLALIPVFLEKDLATVIILPLKSFITDYKRKQLTSSSSRKAKEKALDGNDTRLGGECKFSFVFLQLSI